MNVAKLRSAQVALFARIKKAETMDLAQALTRLGQVLRGRTDMTVLDFPGRAAALARLEELDRKESELASRTGWGGAVAKVEATAVRNRRSKELQEMARTFLATGAASATPDELPSEVVRGVRDVREVKGRVADLKEEAEELARQIVEAGTTGVPAPAGSMDGGGLPPGAMRWVKRAGMSGGALFLAFIMIVVLAGRSQRAERDREHQEYVRKKEESRQRSVAQVPSFEATLAKGVEAFSAGQQDQAEAAFFSAERTAQKMKDEDWDAYIEGKWGSRLAQAKLGRAAVVLARGSDADGAQALIKSAYDASSDASFPVLSAPGEALLAQVKQSSREETDRWLREQEAKEEREKQAQAAPEEKSSSREDNSSDSGSESRSSSSGGSKAKLVTGRGSSYANGYVHGYNTGETLVNDGSGPSRLMRARSNPEGFYRDWAQAMPSGADVRYTDGFVEGCRDALESRRPRYQ